jgi:hypothetical protein
MSHSISIIGAGAYGSRIAQKYTHFPDVTLKAVVSRHKPEQASFKNVPFVTSAAEWKKKFKSPEKNDIFDLCIHQNILTKIMEEFIKIGARNFILPKPITLSRTELDHIKKLSVKHALNITVASQWHYSGIITEISRFIKKNSTHISRIDITFSRSFDEKRLEVYTPHTAFVPHIVQILHTLGLITAETGTIVENMSDTKLRIKYIGAYNIHAESDIRASQRDESFKIYLKGKSKPSLVADFAGVLGKDDFTVYPSVQVDDNKAEVREDVLQKMLARQLSYFNGVVVSPRSSVPVMTLEKYLPVAEGIIKVADRSRKLVAVIGGGVFGIMSAVSLAKKGYSVVVFEKETEILTGASLVNHCRVHMGYHYPRDERTAGESRDARASFEEEFGTGVVRKLDNYYLIAKEGSFTSAEQFVAFCKKLKLPYKKEWPKSFDISRDKISLSVKVPEPIFDANRKRDFLYKKMAEFPQITLLKGIEVTDLKQMGENFEIGYRSEATKGLIQCAAVVNATYGGMNYINNHLGLPLNDLQYELCEIPVVKAPWDGSAWMIIDGPFFSVMPFGYSDKYLFYDVELSVLERTVGKFPEFKRDVGYYDHPGRRAARFKKYHSKWNPWVSGIEKAKQVSSMYVTRVVLPRREKTDERPTIVNQLLPGFWQVFSGKIVTSVPSTIELAAQVDTFLKGKTMKKSRSPALAEIKAPSEVIRARVPR